MQIGIYAVHIVVCCYKMPPERNKDEVIAKTFGESYSWLNVGEFILPLEKLDEMLSKKPSRHMSSIDVFPFKFPVVSLPELVQNLIGCSQAHALKISENQLFCIFIDHCICYITQVYIVFNCVNEQVLFIWTLLCYHDPFSKSCTDAFPTSEVISVFS